MAASPHSVLADFALVVCRAPAEVWGMSALEACLLLGQYVPATAQLFAEFRRLRDGLSPAEARAFAKVTKHKLRHTEMMYAVRLCACPMLRPGACRAAEPKPAAPQVLRRECVQDAWLEQLCTAAFSKPQADTLASLFLDRSQRFRPWAQTLRDAGVAEVLIGEERTCRADVQSAREMGAQCPALLELVCEALGSSGRGPGHMQAW